MYKGRTCVLPWEQAISALSLRVRLGKSVGGLSAVLRCFTSEMHCWVSIRVKSSRGLLGEIPWSKAWVGGLERLQDPRRGRPRGHNGRSGCTGGCQSFYPAHVPMQWQS